MNICFIDSPIGRLKLHSDGDKLRTIEFANQHQGSVDKARGEVLQSDAVLQKSSRQLEEYFAGNRTRFDLPLDGGGTAFQRQVWHALRRIPYGTTCSYRDIAQDIDKPTAVRAVGAANGRNPLPIVVPCHRVVGADGSLTGFAGGLEAKKVLLTLEGAL